MKRLTQWLAHSRPLRTSASLPSRYVPVTSQWLPSAGLSGRPSHEFSPRAGFSEMFLLGEDFQFVYNMRRASGERLVLNTILVQAEDAGSILTLQIPAFSAYPDFFYKQNGLATLTCFLHLL